MIETLQLDAPSPRQKALQVGEGHLEVRARPPEERAAVENDIGVGVLISVAELV